MCGLPLLLYYVHDIKCSDFMLLFPYSDVELPPDLVQNLTATQTFDLDNEVILEWLPPVHPPSTDDIDQHEILWGPVEEGDFTISIEEGRKFVGGVRQGKGQYDWVDNLFKFTARG